MTARNGLSAANGREIWVTFDPLLSRDMAEAADSNVALLS